MHLAMTCRKMRSMVNISGKVALERRVAGEALTKALSGELRACHSSISINVGHSMALAQSARDLALAFRNEHVSWANAVRFNIVGLQSWFRPSKPVDDEVSLAAISQALADVPRLALQNVQITGAHVVDFGKSDPAAGLCGPVRRNILTLENV